MKKKISSENPHVEVYALQVSLLTLYRAYSKRNIKNRGDKSCR